MSHRNNANVNPHGQAPTNEEDEWWDAEDDLSPAEPKPNEAKSTFDEQDFRQKIMRIQKDTSLSPNERAHLIQYLMSNGTLPPEESSASSVTNDTSLDDIGNRSKTYHNEEEGILGCSHYQRKCKLQAHCCGQLFTCRLCHDEKADHDIVRHDTKNMLCMLCSTLQPAAQTCKECGEEMARYYCDKCKLWDDDPDKAIYHCDDCGICRKGRGLGDDYFHCKKCNICMTSTMKDKHRCIERNLESDCPICGDYMFTSVTTVIFMPCGHCIHKECYSKYIENSYQCPTCFKSLGDMSVYFARLDLELTRQPMPEEYSKFISHIFCNDCEKKSEAKYHFFYHKCTHCGSYNTRVLKIENTEDNTGSQSTTSTIAITAAGRSHRASLNETEPLTLPLTHRPPLPDSLAGPSSPSPSPSGRNETNDG